MVSFVAKSLASHKKPQRISLVEAIPRTHIGKINRKLRHDQFCQITPS
ncbi:hypothetical protein [Paraburkholderia bannensis]